MKSISFLSIASCAFLISCSTSQIIVESQPEGAEVIAHYKDLSIKKLGQTPLKMTEEQMNPSGEAFQISINKEKYMKENFIISPSKFPREIKVSSKMTALQNVETAQGYSQRDLSDAANATAQAINYMKMKNYDLAERALTTAIGRYPNIPILYILLGNTFYLKKELDRALAHYKKARDLEPQNLETETMIKKIETLRGNSGVM